VRLSASPPPAPLRDPEARARAAAHRATLRPAVRGIFPALLLGAVGGAVLGGLGQVPPAVTALLGAVAAAVALGVAHATGVRVVLTGEGLGVRGGGLPALSARWEELRVGFGAAVPPGGRLAQRYAILADARGRSFAFAERSVEVPGPLPLVRGLDGEEVPVVDLRDAAILLGVVIQRVPRWDYLPPELQALAPAPEEGVRPEAGPRPAARPGGRLGVVGLLAKLGGTLAKVAKTAKVGWALASLAGYSLLFSGEFGWLRGLILGAALLLQLFVHECGHVHAMRRTGMKVRGMYFIPFLGAVAVSESVFTSRRQQAYVALNGPLWGTAFTLVPVALYLWTHHPLLAMVASWGAFINFFNLLPIIPLDGGRVLHAFAFSFSSALGVALCAAGLAGAVALGAARGHGLLWLVAVLGTMELLSESSARAGGGALRLLPEPERFGLPHFRHLRALAGPPLSSPTEPYFLRNLQRVQQAARAVPLTPRELALWGLAYAGLAACLFVMMVLLARVPGGGGPLQLLG